jgi:hypothetical protein
MAQRDENGTLLARTNVTSLIGGKITHIDYGVRGQVQFHFSNGKSCSINPYSLFDSDGDFFELDI